MKRMVKLPLFTTATGSRHVWLDPEIVQVIVSERSHSILRVPGHAYLIDMAAIDVLAALQADTS